MSRRTPTAPKAAARKRRAEPAPDKRPARKVQHRTLKTTATVLIGFAALFGAAALASRDPERPPEPVTPFTAELAAQAISTCTASSAPGASDALKESCSDLWQQLHSTRHQIVPADGGGLKVIEAPK
jgi:hypothetical protein